MGSASSTSSVLPGLFLLFTWSYYFRVGAGTQFYTPTCDAEFLIANDTGYKGYDIQSSQDVPGTDQYSPTQDPATCCSLCFALTACQAWTVVNSAGYGCYVKNATYTEMTSTAGACEHCV